jgi:hypothetical protein
MIHPKGEPAKARPYPYRCRSWRHEGECRLFKGAQDFARISEAIREHDNWTFLTLTFRINEWPEWKDQYIHACSYWSKLRLRFRRCLFRRGSKRRHIPYIQTWERHKEKGIHAHILLSNYRMMDAVSEDWHKHGGDIDKILKDPDTWHSRVLVPHCTESGFGPRCFAQPLRDGTSEAMAGYLVKLASELVGADAKNQIPFDAPPHFRRLRASKGLLPPIYHGDMTGYLVTATGGRKRKSKEV